MRGRLKLGILVGLILSGCSVKHAQYFAREVHQLDRQEQHAPHAQVLLLFVDGLPSSVFSEMLASGQLPHIKQHLIDRGIYAPRMLAPVPAVPPVTAAVMLSGLHAAFHPLPARYQLDLQDSDERAFAERLQVFNLAQFLQTPSVFDYGRQVYQSALFSSLGEGSDYWVREKLNTGLGFSFEDWQRLDAETLDQAGNRLRVQGKFKRIPQMVAAHLVGPAGASQQDAERYRQYMRWLDAEIGKLMRSFQELGMADDVLVILTSLSGRARARYVDDLSAELHRLLDDHTPLECTQAKCFRPGLMVDEQPVIDTYDAVLVPMGNRSRMVYFRMRDEKHLAEVLRNSSPRDPLREMHLSRYTNNTGRTIDLIDSLAKLESVGLLLYRGNDGGTVQIASRSGKAEIRMEMFGGQPRYRYEVIRGEDPLDYRGFPELRSVISRGFHPASVWVDATKHTAYPGLIASAAKWFAHPRTGDLWMVAQTGYGFDAATWGYGGLGADDRMVPLIVAGGGVQTRIAPVLTAADVLPMLLHALGFDDPELLPLLEGQSWCPYFETCRYTGPHPSVEVPLEGTIYLQQLKQEISNE